MVFLQTGGGGGGGYLCRLEGKKSVVFLQN